MHKTLRRTGNIAAIILVLMTPAFAWSQSNNEQDLLVVLRSADSPAAEKAITCKKLAIHGSKAAVPDLARLLPDPQLSSWARIALEAIPGPESNKALRDAAESLDGLLLVGTINSIGVRRDAEAVGLLSAKLKDQDAEVASAAAVALGKIGNGPATETLQKALASAPAKVRSAVAEGCVLIAEQLHADGHAAEAAKLYDEVRSAKVPKQRIIEATRGAILARGQEGIPLLLKQFRSPDKSFFQLALGTAREFPGGEVDKALAKELGQAAPDRAALIIHAMADRPATIDLTAVLKAAEAGPKPVRLAATDALGRVGNATCLSVLVDIALESDEELSRSAKDSLTDLPGGKVDDQIVARLAKAEGKPYPLLIELVGKRRIDAESELLKALEHSDNKVRSAALASLGETVSLKRLPILVSQVVSPKHAEDLAAAEKALKAASVRMPDREACAGELAMALDRAPAKSKTPLMEILAEVGGTKALTTLASAAKSDDPQLQDDGSRLLGKWNSVAAAPVLLDLSKTAPEGKYQIRALRGYLGLARKFAMPEAKRAEMCRKAIATATRQPEKQLALEVMKIHPSTDSLALAVVVIEIPELKDDATAATLFDCPEGGWNAASTCASCCTNAGHRQPVKLENRQGGVRRWVKRQKDVTAVLQQARPETLPLITLCQPQPVQRQLRRRPVAWEREATACSLPPERQRGRSHVRRKRGNHLRHAEVRTCLKK